MANLSEIQAFFNKFDNKEVKVLKDINFFDTSLFKNETFYIQKTDKELIQNLAFKLSPTSKITEYLMIIEK